MDERQLSELTQRLGRLEREVAWWRRVGLPVALLVFGMLVTGQVLPTSRTVEAQNFVVKDGKGKVRAVLGAQWIGLAARPSTELWGPGVAGAPPGLHVYGADGRYRAGFTLWNDEGPGYIVLHDKDTGSRMDMSVGAGIASLELKATEATHQEVERAADEFAKRFNTATTEEDRMKAMRTRRYESHRAVIGAWSRGGRSYLSLGRYPTGEHSSGVISATSDKGEASISLTDADGVSRVILGHAQLENRRTGVGERRPASSLVLLDKDAQVIWKAP